MPAEMLSVTLNWLEGQPNDKIVRLIKGVSSSVRDLTLGEQLPVQYSPESDFEFTIGTIPEGTYSGAIITKYLGTNPIVNIPPTLGGQPVVSLGQSCFDNSGQGGALIQLQVSSITMPNSVKKLDAYCLKNNGLTNIVLSNSLKYINEPFQYTLITDLIFPEGIVELLGYLSNIPNLISVKFPSTIIRIGTDGANWFSVSQLQQVICDAIVPPIFETQKDTLGVSLIVPTASIDDYKASPYWSGFYYPSGPIY